MTQQNSSETTPATENGGGDLFNTAAGWVLFAAGLGLGLSILAGKYFHGGDPQRPEQLGYVIEGAIEEGEADAGPSLAVVLASASAEDGAKVFAKCQACHNVEQGGANGIGPSLYGVMGKGIAQNAPSFGYSSALSDKGGEWTWENMDAWLASPRNFANGTSMSFAGLSSAEDRADVMAYLEANGGAPPRPVPEEPAADEVAEADAVADAEAAQDDAAATSEETAAAEASE